MNLTPDWIWLGDFIAQVNLKMEDVNGFTIKMLWSEEIGVLQSLININDISLSLKTFSNKEFSLRSH